MSFFELDISPKDRAVARFIGSVRKALMQAAFLEKETAGVTQQSIAEKIGVNRSVINRMLKGESNLTLRSVAEIAWALGMQAEMTLQKFPISTSARVTSSGLAPDVRRHLHFHVGAAKGFSDGTKPTITRVEVISAPSSSNDNYAPLEVAV